MFSNKKICIMDFDCRPFLTCDRAASLISSQKNKTWQSEQNLHKKVTKISFLAYKWLLLIVVSFYFSIFGANYKKHWNKSCHTGTWQWKPMGLLNFARSKHKPCKTTQHERHHGCKNDLKDSYFHILGLLVIQVG